MNAWRRAEKLVLAARPDFDYVQIERQFQGMGLVVRCGKLGNIHVRSLYLRSLPTNAAKAAKVILDTLDREDAQALAESLQ